MKMPMNLYVVKRTRNIGHDEARGFVVRAETETRARTLCAANSSDEGKSPWLLSATVTKIGEGEGDYEVILRDYLHG